MHRKNRQTDKMKIQKKGKYLAIFGVILFSFQFANVTNAALQMSEITPTFNIPLPINKTAKSSLVLNQVTGEVLYEENGDARHIPASLTKLVTALVALDIVPDWNARCRVSSEDQVGGVQMRFSQYYSYKLSDLLQASLVPSANDAAHAISRCSGIARDQFVVLMNEKVKQFGAFDSSFVEPTGLSEKNYTTARDFAKVANAALSTPRLRDILAKKSIYICGTSTVTNCQTLRNTNMLLGDSELSMVAGKTGFLEESGYNFASSSKDAGGHYYIVVVLGSDSKTARFQETKELWKFASAKQRYLDLLAGVGMVAGASMGF